MRRNILITGTSSGLGAEMARQFGALCHNLMLTPFIVDTVKGVRAIVKAIEAERAKAYVPSWQWVPMARFLKYAPLPLLKRMI